MHEKNRAHARRLKTFLFAALPLVLVLAAAEVAGRIIFFQIRSDNYCALQCVYERLRLGMLQWHANRLAAHYRENFEKAMGPQLYEPRNREMLEHLEAQYERYFLKLKQEVEGIQAKFVLLYIPYVDYTHSYTLGPSRRFFQRLADKHGVDFVDVTEEFLKYPPEVVKLLPQDGHVSRFGNQVVARILAQHLRKYQGYRSPFHFPSHPRLMGDLVGGPFSSRRRRWNQREDMPYTVITNRQGLRNEKDVLFPKTKLRILTLGDSYTFGPHLPNSHTYPYFLERYLPDSEVFNAAAESYTVSDEEALFDERAKFVEPDIVLLQCLDNDLTDFFWFQRNIYDRARAAYVPDAVEKAYFETLDRQ